MYSDWRRSAVMGLIVLGIFLAFATSTLVVGNQPVEAAEESTGAEEGTWQKAKRESGEAAGSVGTATKETAGDAWGATKGTAGKAWGATKETAGKAWGATKETAGKVWDATKGAASDGGDAAQDGAQDPDEPF